MVGDLLISGSKEQESPLDIPTRFNKAQSDVSLYFVDLSQKVVIINDHLAVAWAGSKLVATYLIQRIADQLKPPYTPDKLLEQIYCAGLLDSELASVSFIFYCLTDPEHGRGFVQDYLTGETILDNKTKFKYAGSGTKHFLESIDFNLVGVSEKPSYFEESFGAIIGRLAIALYHEVTSSATHDVYYGGGFELLFFDPIARRLFKVPLTFVFWEFSDKAVLLHGPIITLNYGVDGYLFVHRIAKDETGKFTLKTYSVGNLLNEGRVIPEPASPTFNTSCTVHFFTSSVSDATRMMIHGDDANKFMVRYSPETGEVNVMWSETFFKEANTLVGL